MSARTFVALLVALLAAGTASAQEQPAQLKASSKTARAPGTNNEPKSNSIMIDDRFRRGLA
jgi:hypothetical protein